MESDRKTLNDRHEKKETFFFAKKTCTNVVSANQTKTLKENKIHQINPILSGKV